MPTQVLPKLVLEAVDANLSPGTSPTASSYPDRVICPMPKELHPLLADTEIEYDLPSGTDPYLTLASNIVASSLGSGWGVRLYTSGHLEQSGKWQSGTASIYHLQKNSTDYTDDLVGVDPDCTLRFLLRLKPVT